jgi:hypothetical protein
MGVAALSSLVQGRNQVYAQRLAAGGVTGELLSQQSTVLAMHTSFLAASGLVLAAVVAMSLASKRGKGMGAPRPELAQPAGWDAEPGSIERS